MLTVINQPTPDHSKLEVVCLQCSAIIHFEKADAETSDENVTSNTLTITCPVCAATVSKVLNKKVSERVVRKSDYHPLP